MNEVLFDCKLLHDRRPYVLQVSEMKMNEEHELQSNSDEMIEST